MIVDVHAHIIVPELIREAAPDEEWRPRVFWQGAQQIVEFGGRQIRSAVAEFVHIEQILEVQAAAGVDQALLSPWVPLLRYDASAEEARRTGRMLNEALARLAQRFPQQVSALGAVPLQAPEVAARELEQVMRTPGLCGVEVAASVRGVYLGDDRFRPFWAAAEATGAVVFIHPTTLGFEVPALQEYYLWNTVGNPLETTVTVAHMIMAGVMEAHPRLRVLLAHGGGGILALRGRLRHAHAFQPQAKSRLRESPEASLRRFHFDTVTHDAALLRSLIDYVGAEHVLLGSDYPFDMGTLRPVDAVRAVELTAAEEALILGDNAARLLQLPAADGASPEGPHG